MKEEKIVLENEKKVSAKSMTANNLSTKIFYGDSKAVTCVGNLDYNDHSIATKRNQSLEGFDDKYRDFVDYIMKITHNIWEEKGIGIIYDTYHNNVTMHAGSKNIVGIKEVIAGTMQTLHAFPDRRLIGQNVIWSKHGINGFLSSHRVQSTATNLGVSAFGPATNKKVNFRTTIDCAVENNRIYEEWLVRDNLWLVIQLGFDPYTIAKASAKSLPAIQNHFGLNESMNGQLVPEIHSASDASVGEMILEITTRINNYKYFNEVTKYYHDNAVVHFVCNEDLKGHDEIQGMLISLYASFPNSSYSVERVTINQRDEVNEYDVAVRYRIRGLNEGIGYFGSPTFKQVDLLGINHFHIVDNKIQEEWVTFDGLDVLTQMYAGYKESKEENNGE